MTVAGVNVTSIIKAVLAFPRGRQCLEQGTRPKTVSVQWKDGAVFQAGSLSLLDTAKLRCEVHRGTILSYLSSTEICCGDQAGVRNHCAVTVLKDRQLSMESCSLTQNPLSRLSH